MRRESATLTWLCRLAPLAALAALAWSLRGAPLGSAVADDFEFLARLRFGPPLALFDSMGASYYWRPLSRQAWFSLVGPWLIAAPAAAAMLHAGLLLAIAWLLGRSARRFVSAPAAALLATAPLLSEPARVLIDWPSGSQHLLAALGVAAALHESLAGRRWSAALASLAAALSHEFGALAFAMIPLGGLARGGARSLRIDLPLSLALGILWLGGYRLAIAHGVKLPFGTGGGSWGAAAALSLGATLGTETAPRGWLPLLQGGSLLVIAVSLPLILLRARGARRRAVAALVLLPLAAWAFGLAPIAQLLPDWNAWRAFLPITALAFGLTALAAEAHLLLGLSLVVLRIVALLVAQSPSPVVSRLPPDSVSDLSLARITRVQQVVRATERAVREARPRPPARVGYLGIPQLTMNGFRDSLAVRVWLGDPHATFYAVEGEDALEARMPDLVLSYDLRPGKPLVVPITRAALISFRDGLREVRAGGEADGCEHFRAALAAQAPEAPSLSAQLLHALTICALNQNRLAEAESLNAQALLVRGVTPDTYAVEAYIALQRGDLGRAERALALCFKDDPGNIIALAVQDELRRRLPGSGGPAGTPPDSPASPPPR